jgi:hypothetical protein
MAKHSNMARILTLQHMEKLVRTADGDPPPPPLLAPNQIQLHSYYKPGLLAGNYTIEAEQSIVSEGQNGEEKLAIYNRRKADPIQDPPIIAPQHFEVVAPQFSLDPKLVNSHYPPDGHQDEARVLPHIVLSDPYFPWERKADNSIAEVQDGDLNAAGQFLDASGSVVSDETQAAKRNAVPWVRMAGCCRA